MNFGLFTNLWDHFYGTYTFDTTRRFDSSILGIAGEPAFPVGYTQQLLYPFEQRRSDVGVIARPFTFRTIYIYALSIFMGRQVELKRA